MTCCVDYFRSHFIDTVRNKSSTSPEYRMVGLIPGAGSPGNAGGGLLGVALPKPLRVRTFSRFEKSPNGGGGGGGSGGPSQLQLHLNKERKYLVSTHSVIIDRPASTSAAPPPLAPSLATSIHSGNGSPKLVTTTTTSSVQAKNPTLSSMLSPSSSPALLSKPLPSSLMSGLANDSLLFLFAFEKISSTIPRSTQQFHFLDLGPLKNFLI